MELKDREDTERKIQEKRKRLNYEISEMKRNRERIEMRRMNKSIEQSIKQYILRCDEESSEYGIIDIEEYIDAGSGFETVYLSSKRIIGSRHEFDLSQRFGVPFKDARDSESFVHCSHPVYEDTKVHSATFKRARPDLKEVQRRTKK